MSRWLPIRSNFLAFCIVPNTADDWLLIPADNLIRGCRDNRRLTQLTPGIYSEDGLAVFVCPLDLLLNPLAVIDIHSHRDNHYVAAFDLVEDCGSRCPVVWRVMNRIGSWYRIIPEIERRLANTPAFVKNPSGKCSVVP